MVDFVELEQKVIFALSGKHVERYLQGRVSNDIRFASSERVILAAALSPQGRTEALFRLW